jgi:hypothetical protein
MAQHPRGTKLARLVAAIAIAGAIAGCGGSSQDTDGGVSTADISSSFIYRLPRTSTCPQ